MIVSVSPLATSVGVTAVMVGISQSGFIRPASNASESASATLVKPFRFTSPTAFGSGGFVIPPTASAITNASAIFTVPLPFMSPRDTTVKFFTFDIEAPLATVKGKTPRFASADAGTVHVSLVGLTNAVGIVVSPMRIVELELKFCPFTVKVKDPPTNGTTDWLRPGGSAFNSLMTGAASPLLKLMLSVVTVVLWLALLSVAMMESEFEPAFSATVLLQLAVPDPVAVSLVARTPLIVTEATPLSPLLASVAVPASVMALVDTVWPLVWLEIVTLGPDVSCDVAPVTVNASGRLALWPPSFAFCVTTSVHAPTGAPLKLNVAVS